MSINEAEEKFNWEAGGIATVRISNFNIYITLNLMFKDAEGKEDWMLYEDPEDRQILTAQDSHVQPGVDVGQLILQKQKWKFLCVLGEGWI